MSSRLLSAHKNVNIVTQSIYDTLLKEILKLLQHSHTFTLLDSTVEFNDAVGTNVLDHPLKTFLMVVGNIDVVSDVLRDAIHVRRQHRQSMYIILLPVCITSEESVQMLFYTAWDLKMLNVFVLWYEGNHESRSLNTSASVINTSTHTYNPFLSLWTENRTQITIVPFTNEDNLKKVHSQLDNLNGYPLIVSNAFLLTSSTVVIKDNTRIQWISM